MAVSLQWRVDSEKTYKSRAKLCTRTTISSNIPPFNSFSDPVLVSFLKFHRSVVCSPSHRKLWENWVLQEKYNQ